MSEPVEHEYIYLQPLCQCVGADDQLWCWEDQGPCEDCGAPWLRYVRAGYGALPTLSERDDTIAGEGDEAGKIEGEPR